MDLISNALDIDPYYNNNKFCTYVVVKLLYKRFRDELIFLFHPAPTTHSITIGEFIRKNI